MSDGRDDDPVEPEAGDETPEGDLPETAEPETEVPGDDAGTDADDDDTDTDAAAGDPDDAEAGDEDDTDDEATDGEATDDGDEAGDEDDTGDEEDTDDEAASTAAKKKSGPPPRPGKGRKKGEKGTGPKRPSGPKGSRKARRRRFGAAHGAVLVTLLLLGGQIALISTSDAKPSGWAWILLAGLAGCFVWSLTNLAEKRGKLTKLRNRGLAALAFVLALAAFSITTVIVTDSSPQLGLDLQGGFSVVLSAEGNPSSDTIDQAMEIIRNRIDGLGVAEPEVTRQGDNVVVDLPGIEDRQRAQEILGETAQLEFRPVLQSGLSYDAEAAAAGEDPCAAGAEALAEATATTTTAAADDSTTTTAAGDSTTTTAADDGSTTTAAEESTTTAAEEPASTDEEGAVARPAPAAPAVPVDGEYAAPPLRRQDSTTTTAGEETTTTAAGETTTTAAGETTTTAAGETTTTTTEPADPAAEASNTIVVPDRPDPDADPASCTQVGPAGFDGSALSKARAELGGDTGSQWVVTVAVKGSQRDTANELINHCASVDETCPTGQMAIVLDDEVISAPTVNDADLADQDFYISGGGDSGFKESEAKDLALKLRYGALPVEFTRSAERQVSPTLGEDSLRAGVLAGLIGLAAVALYLIMYYRALGVVVLLGLGVWSALMYGTVCWLSATRGLTLSLSGVVGIVVSLGTTVDSYVVHFERLKDEVRLGKSVRASTEKGFQKAFKTILTADLASLMGAALLWYLTVGAVRGFAFFLGLSVVLDLLVAYCFDRPMVALLARSRFFTEHRIFGVARGLGRSGDEGGGARPTPKAKSGAAT